jgi:Flp pilus assembly CpaE family ATPase
MQKALKATLATIIPEDRNVVLQALNTGKPLPKVAPTSKAVVALRKLAKSFDTDTPKAGNGLLARLFAKAPAAPKEPRKKK